MVESMAFNESSWSWSGAFDALRSFTYKDVYDDANDTENIIPVDDTADKGFIADEYIIYEKALKVLIGDVVRAIEKNLTQEGKLDSQIEELVKFETDLDLFTRKFKKFKTDNKKFRASKDLRNYNRDVTWLKFLQEFLLANKEPYVGVVDDDIEEKFLEFFNATPKR